MLNLIKMERYQLFRNRIYQISTLAVFVLGFFMADTYLIDSPGDPGGEPKTLTDIWNSMIYDSTFLLILLSCLARLSPGGRSFPAGQLTGKSPPDIHVPISLPPGSWCCFQPLICLLLFIQPRVVCGSCPVLAFRTAAYFYRQC